MHRTTTLLIGLTLSLASQAHQDKHHPAAKSAASPREVSEISEVIETAFGRSGDPAQVARTIDIRMHDTLRFDPADITVRQGETVRLRARNEGRGLHEIVLGRDEELREHAALMRKFPNMEHDAPYMAHVAPGQQGDIVWQFTEPGRYQFACLVAGHYEAGMVGTVTVVAQAADEHAGHHASNNTSNNADRNAASDTVQGEVRRVNREQSTVTLRHEPLKVLGMPAMTMVFAVRDARQLDALKVGDKVQFTVIQDADGGLIVTQIQPAP